MRKKIIAYWQMKVRQWYQDLRVKEDFILSTKEIKVKKGKLKYFLTFIETTQGTYELYTDRHS